MAGRRSGARWAAERARGENGWRVLVALLGGMKLAPVRQLTRTAGPQDTGAMFVIMDAADTLSRQARRILLCTSPSAAGCCAIESTS